MQAARDGVEALTAALRERPRVILMDLTMPRMDGWEATRHLKADARTKDIVVVAVTAHASDDDGRAQRAGCDYFMSKPVALDQLETMVRAAIDGTTEPPSPRL